MELSGEPPHSLRRSETAATDEDEKLPQCSASYPDDYAVCPKDGAALRDASLWQVNTIIRGRYKILALLGEGGMATVYKAHHQLLDEVRALKVIKADLARDALFVQRFKNEAINTRKLQHPNAVRVDDLDIAEDGRPFISMEFVEGESLKSLMQRTGSLGAGQTLDLALQVCQALEAAHGLGLIHRDIKPDNVYLVPRRGATPLVKVLDFGIARLKEEAPGGAKLRSMTLTGTGVVIGTPEYMSPEQALGKHGEQLDGRSDLYSLGIVMYRMLTGELPFQADTTAEMILHHIQTIPQPPQALKPGLRIPDEVSAIVMRALEKNREKRYPSAAAMAEAIRQALRTFPAESHRPSAAPEIGAGAEPTQQSLISPVQPALAAPVRPVQPAPPRPAALAPATAPRRSDAGVKPAPPARKKFPMLPALAGVVVVALIILGVTRRNAGHRPALQTEPATSPAAPPPAQPASTQPELSPPQGTSSATPGGEAPRPEPSPPSEGSQERTPPQSQPEPRSPTTDQLHPTESGDHLGSEIQPPGPQAKPLKGLERQEIRRLGAEGLQLFKAGQYESAAQKFRQILEINPTNKPAQRALKKCLNKMREQWKNPQK